QLHRRLEVFELEDALLEDWRRQVLARVASGTRQRLDDVAQGWRADVEPRRDLVGRDAAELLAQLGDALAVVEDLGPAPQLRKELVGSAVALGMNPGSVERIVATSNLEEAGGLREARLADAVHLHQLRPLAEGTVRLAVLDQVMRDQLIHPRNVP